MSPPLLSIENLRVALPAWSDRAEAVSDVSLTLQRNEIVCVVGESGSGKSVMAKAILGLLPAPHVRVTGGRILFEGRDVLSLPPAEMRALRGSRIGMIFQEPMAALNPLMSIGRQVEEVLEVHGTMSARERRARVEALLADVHLPDILRIIRSYPHQLSGGQRQRVMIAMALALEPALIIADEPTTALDVTTQAQILRLIKELQQARGTAVLFITHDFGVVAEIADRIAVMRHGKLVEQNAAPTLLAKPEADYTRDLLAAVPRLAPRQAQVSPKAPEPLLVVRGLCKTYDGHGGWFKRQPGVRAVNDASFEIAKGRSLALVGESGSGKSTLARCIIGLETPDAGEIQLDGARISGLSRSEMRPLRRDLQMVFQDPLGSLNPRQRVGDIIALGPRIQGVPADEAAERVADLLRLVGLRPEAASRYPHEFSGGQRQRIGIARALAVKPKLVVADEPVSALDVSVQKQVLELLDDLRHTLGLSLLFITHDLRVAATVCDEIAVMQRGVIVERGSSAAIFGAPQHAYTRALIDAVPGKRWLGADAG